jgi:tRNA U34 5-methylaminomethyl-2-thiouridine-forming methyltransferase MnmC
MFNPDQIQIRATEDGSATLYNAELDETYHSVHGALGESLHVYIENGLKKIPAELKEVNILELGFGTGLNALLTLDHQPAELQINYFTLEPYPIPLSLMQAYYSRFSVKPASLPLLEHMCSEAAESLCTLRPGFRFKRIPKMLQNLQASDLSGAEGNLHAPGLIYYDAFAPSKQAGMWTIETLSRATDLMPAGGILSTYCAQGQFKRHLRTLGFQIESPPGAYGKRQMTVATKG